MNGIILRPGEIRLAEWRAIYRGAAASLDPASYPAISRSAEVRSGRVARAAGEHLLPELG